MTTSGSRGTGSTSSLLGVELPSLETTLGGLREQWHTGDAHLGYT
jgi:hypothetical protein